LFNIKKKKLIFNIAGISAYAWEITDEQREHWLLSFDKHKGKKSGKISESKFIKLLKPMNGASIPKHIIPQIIGLCRVGTGKFSLEEFLIAKALSEGVSRGCSLPLRLPPPLQITSIHKVR